MGIAPDSSVYQKGIRMKRTSQCGLQLYVASTFHSTMGKTLLKLATRVDETGDPSSPYALWDPTQIVILFSRTRLPRDTFFVTKNPGATARAIYRVLKKKSAFRTYLTDLLERLCSGGSHEAPMVVDHSLSIFRPRDVPVKMTKRTLSFVSVLTFSISHCAMPKKELPNLSIAPGNSPKR